MGHLSRLKGSFATSGVLLGDALPPTLLVRMERKNTGREGGVGKGAYLAVVTNSKVFTEFCALLYGIGIAESECLEIVESGQYRDLHPAFFVLFNLLTQESANAKTQRMNTLSHKSSDRG